MRSATLRFPLLLATAVVTLPATARAQPVALAEAAAAPDSKQPTALPAAPPLDAAIEEARTHFEAGQALYEKLEFAKAADEFMAAHAKKPFPAFLFNAANCHEQLREFERAIELLERYLKDLPSAADRGEVEDRIKQLKEEGSRPAPAEAPSPRPLVVSKSVTVVESNPEGAMVRLDDLGGKELGPTNWSGELPAGKHTISLELKGYKREQKVIVPSKQVQFAYYFFRLAEDPELGYLVVTSNVPDAYLYLDGQPEVWGRVSSERNLKKGKHHISVARDGYVRKEMDIEIQAAKLNTVPVQLEPAPMGFVRVRSVESIRKAKVDLDGKEVCATVPCRFEASEGGHRLLVHMRGKNPLLQSLNVDRLTESTLNATLHDNPPRYAAIGFFVAAVVIGAGGTATGLLASQQIAEGFGLKNNMTMMVDPGTKDGVAIALISISGGIGAILLGLGINELVAQRGLPSTATVDKKDLALTPVLGPTYAGLKLRF